MAELESALQRRCQKILKDNDAFVFKTHGDMYSRIGIPDLVACVPVTVEKLQDMIANDWFRDGKVGVFLSFELKRRGKLDVYDTRRRAQEIVGEEIKDAGGIWIATDDSDIVEAIVYEMKGDNNAVQ